MQTAKQYFSSWSWIALLCFSIFAALLWKQDLFTSSFLQSAELQSFKTMLISIVLEALPFVLVGVLISSILHIFVPEKVVSRLIPRNPVIGVIFASLLGIVFPVCECGMIPVVRRLMRKGMPLYIAVVFILSGPIINPVVFASTYMAFRSRPEMAYARIGLAFFAAAVIGLYIYYFVRYNALRKEQPASPSIQAPHEHHSPSSCEHVHSHTYMHSYGKSGGQHEHSHEHHHGENRLLTVLSHASDEFFEMGKYLILGALITAGVQTFIAREALVSIGQDGWISHFFMMGFAYILSICSTSDAFVASSFSTTFTSGSILTFLVFGAMLDFKGTLMLMSVFKKRFVLLLGVLIVITVFIGSMLSSQFILH